MAVSYEVKRIIKDLIDATDKKRIEWSRGSVDLLLIAVEAYVATINSGEEVFKVYVMIPNVDIGIKDPPIIVNESDVFYRSYDPKLYKELLNSIRNNIKGNKKTSIDRFLGR